MSLARAEQATQEVAFMRPAQLWTHIARLDCQFLLLADSNHADDRIIDTVSQVLPMLAKAGYRHIGLERDNLQHAAAYAAFQAAAPHDKAARHALLTHLEGNHNPAIAACAGRDAALACEFNLQAAIRATGMQQYLLRQQEDFEDYAARMVPPDKAMRYDMLIEAYDGTGTLPPGATQREMNAALAVYDRWDAQNLRRDKRRMQTFSKAVGQEKGIVFYGADHFRRSRTEGMDKHLPKGSSVVVMLGEEGLVGGDIASNWLRHRGSVPDFVITTDTRKAFVLPPALRNGLWRL